MPILINAVIVLEPDRAKRCLLDAQLLIEASRAEAGCIAYDWAIDPAVPDRINVFEEWESEDALAAHFRDTSYAAMRAHLGDSGIVSAQSRKYRCDAVETVYDASGTPQPYFSGVSQ
jgi:quinol monooxygenase YgiN